MKKKSFVGIEFFSGTGTLSNVFEQKGVKMYSLHTE